MISNHTQFVAAIAELKQVNVRFYSVPDSGVVDRVCAPLDYGPGGGVPDGLNRYWLWNLTVGQGPQLLSLVPEQIESLDVLGGVFDPAQLDLAPLPWTIPRPWTTAAKPAPITAAASPSAPNSPPSKAT